jgi:hypothetical protein
MYNELALARSSKRLKMIQNEINSLLYEADVNSPYHYTLKTDAKLLRDTVKLLQKLKREKPSPVTSRKYTREEDVTYYPAINEIIIHVSGAAISDDHNQYSQSLEDAYHSIENYMGKLKQMHHDIQICLERRPTS